MKHPNRDEWAPYVFGEAPAAEARRLEAHLESCEECAAEIAGWQRSLKMLDSWPVAPRPRAQPLEHLLPRRTGQGFADYTKQVPRHRHTLDGRP